MDVKYEVSGGQNLGEIVSVFPGSAEIFNEYKIDYCCGGHDTLKEALKEKNIPEQEFLKKMNSAYESFVKEASEYKDWRREEPQKLIKHIINSHHQYTKKELKDIDFLMTKILKVHFKSHGEELLKLHRLFGGLKIELEEHLVKEEENLFPLMTEYFANKDAEGLEEIQQFILDTEEEHDAAGDILKEIEKLTGDFTPPEDGCNTYRLVYSKLDALEKDLFMHIYLENTVLFGMV